MKTLEPKVGSKNPRSCEKTQGVATLCWNAERIATKKNTRRTEISMEVDQNYKGTCFH